MTSKSKCVHCFGVLKECDFCDNDALTVENDMVYCCAKCWLERNKPQQKDKVNHSKGEQDAGE